MTEAYFLQALGGAVLNNLWQLALLWVIYQLCIMIYPAAGSALKSRLASTLLFAGFGWFIYTLIVGLKAGSVGSTVWAGSVSDDSLLGNINNTIRRSLPYASIAYLVLLIFPLLGFTRNFRYVQVIRKNGLSKIDADWRLFVTRIAAHMGIKKPVHVYVSEWVNSPVTIGFLKPVILIPFAAVNHLSPSQMEAILLHELAHIRRMDYLLNFALNFIRVILYFNPFASAFLKIVETERERSCDEMVMQFQYDSHDYAAALLTLQKVSRRNQVLVVAAAGNTDLLSRIELLLGVQKKQRLNLRRLAAVACALLTVIGVNALMTITHKQPVTESYRGVSLMPDGVDGKNMAALIESPEKMIYNAMGAGQFTKPATQAAPAIDHEQMAPPPPPPDPGMMTARFDMPVSQQVSLSAAQEKQVKQAMEASRKLMETVQWEEVEKSLADVFTEEEKAEMKNEWKNEVNKYDWKKLEAKMRVAYDRVNWPQVNSQLDFAMKQIHMDSLVNVYNHRISEINDLQKTLCMDSLQGIPDSDITLKALADKQKQIEKAVRQLRYARERKIIKL